MFQNKLYHINQKLQRKNTKQQHIDPPHIVQLEHIKPRPRQPPQPRLLLRHQLHHQLHQHRPQLEIRARSFCRFR